MNLTNGLAKFFLSTGYIGIADWSPDGTSIVYAEYERGIFLTDTTGRNTEQILNFGFRPRWSPDGQCIAFYTQDIGAVAGENAVFLYHLADKKVRQLSPNNGLKFAMPDWSPDGRWSVCIGGIGSLWEIWLIEAATGKAQPISEYGTWLKNPVWSPSGDFIYFLSNPNGPFDIWQTPVNLHEGRLQGKPVQLTAGLNVNSMDISPQGDRIVFTREETKASIVQIPLARGMSQPLQQAKLIMENLGPTENLEISPDGKNLVIETLFGGIRSLLLKALVDGNEKVLYREQPPYAPSWSADGKWIAFDAGGGNNADIFRVPATGGPAEKIIASPDADWMPAYSPDGKRLCFLSNRSGQFDLWVHHLISGEDKQLTHTPAPESRGAWSHDGQKLAYFQDNVPEASCTIRIYNFAEQQEKELLRYPSTKSHVVCKLVWKHDDSALYFFKSASGSPLIEVSVIDGRTNTVIENKRNGIEIGNNAFAILHEMGYFIVAEEAIDLWMAEGLR
jgi:Tol biopolymer transport system component